MEWKINLKSNVTAKGMRLCQRLYRHTSHTTTNWHFAMPQNNVYKSNYVVHILCQMCIWLFLQFNGAFLANTASAPKTLMIKYRNDISAKLEKKEHCDNDHVYITCIYIVSMFSSLHYSDVIMGTMASLISSLTSVYSTVHSCADQRKHQSSASLTFVRWIHQRPVNSPHKWPVTRKMFTFDDVIMG